MIDTPHTTSPAGVHELAGLLMAVTERMRASFEAVCSRYDLTPQQARALLGLKERAPMRALAEHMRCDASNITGIADRLEARDLIRREAPENDRRVKLLALTPDGDRIRERLENAVLEESPVMAHLTSAERDELRRLLMKMVIGSRDEAPEL